MTIFCLRCAGYFGTAKAAKDGMVLFASDLQHLDQCLKLSPYSAPKSTVPACSSFGKSYARLWNKNEKNN